MLPKKVAGNFVFIIIASNRIDKYVKKFFPTRLWVSISKHIDTALYEFLVVLISCFMTVFC